MTNISFSNLVSVIFTLVILGFVLGLTAGDTVEWLHPLRSRAEYDAAQIENDVQRAKAEAEIAKTKAEAEAERARLISETQKQQRLNALAAASAETWAALKHDLARVAGHAGIITLSISILTVTAGLTITAVMKQSWTKAPRPTERWDEKYKQLRIAEARQNERLHRMYVREKYQELFSGTIPEDVYAATEVGNGHTEH